jgi:endonuclease YncB( thermonuclease family)
MRKYLVSLLLCLAFAVPAYAANKTQPATAVLPQFTGLVISVADGDTFTVITHDKQQVKIRLYGIDCPENGQAFSKRARDATSAAVFGQNVTVQPLDPDRDGRTVALVLMPGGKSLNEHLVRDGLAWVYPQYCKQEEICAPLRQLEQAVRRSKRGLWVDKEPVPPWEWRRRRK